LAESLWLNYPIGSLLLWNSQQQVEMKNASDAQQPNLWVVDGQQRATALSILFGRKPYWWPGSNGWDQLLHKYDIRFDIDTKVSPFFWVMNAAFRKVKEDRYIQLSRLLNLDINKVSDQQNLMELAKKIKYQGLCDGMDAMEVYTRLDRIRKIRDLDVVTVTINHDLEDVVEIFSRLNSKGTRVTEADIYLGVVAARTPGWVHNTFLPYLNQLKDYGFDINPNLLFRTITGIGVKKVRFREISDQFWNNVGKSTSDDGKTVWHRTTSAWTKLLKQFQDYGILCNDLLPTEAALVTMTALIDRFSDESFKPALYWFLQATRYSRYSASPSTALEEDLRDILEGKSFYDTIKKLLARIPQIAPLDADDFLFDYIDSRFGRFFLYLLIYHNQAVDWDKSGNRIGFDGASILQDYRPQWHHIFPQKYLEGKVNTDLIDALANIAVIGPTINIRISAKAPMDYIQRYDITFQKLNQQYVSENISIMPVEKYETWLLDRAICLADAGNKFFEELKEGL
jgi:Protein of unknown function DUF262